MIAERPELLGLDLLIIGPEVVAWDRVAAGRTGLMIDLTDDQRQQLATFKDRLARVERGEVWGSDHPGPYTAEEKTREIARIKAIINSIEETS